MVKLSVCIEMYWPDLPFDERVRRVHAAGIGAFEFWNHSDKDVVAIQAAQAETGMAIAGLVSEPGFSLTRYGNTEEMVRGVSTSAAIVRSLGGDHLIVTTGNTVAGESYEMTRRRVVRKLAAMASAAESEGVILCLEPLNIFVDHPDYWLTTMAQAADIVEEIDSPSMKILYDIYHQQITEGNVIANLEKYHHLIGHIHVAGVPGRGKLVGGDLDYRAIFAAINRIDYDGYVGLEYRSPGEEEETLSEALSLL
jgi:hydroxypyruvate isomerase